MLRVFKFDVFHLSVFASVACVFGKIMGDKGGKIHIFVRFFHFVQKSIIFLEGVL